MSYRFFNNTAQILCNILKETSFTLLLMKNVFVIDHTFFHSYLDDQKTQFISNIHLFSGSEITKYSNKTMQIYAGLLRFAH